MADEESTKEYPIDTSNQFFMTGGRNLPNHTTSMQGRGAFVKAALNIVPIFRTKQEAYRYCAYALTIADTIGLPDEPGDHTWEDVLHAIQNS